MEAQERPSIVSINISKNKGSKKKPIAKGTLLPGSGLLGDAHGGDGYRELSLLGLESIEAMCQNGLDLKAGDFAENITTKGVELAALPIGTTLRLGREAVIEISQIGKECHKGCAIKTLVGSCVMPKEGIFAKVLSGGKITPGDLIEIIT